jgi:hypothetical protein
MAQRTQALVISAALRLTHAFMGAVLAMSSAAASEVLTAQASALQPLEVVETACRDILLSGCDWDKDWRFVASESRGWASVFLQFSGSRTAVTAPIFSSGIAVAWHRLSCQSESKNCAQRSHATPFQT